MFLLILLTQALVASVTLNAALALGEETGWRGYLLPALLPLGRLPALLLTGLIWAVWHLPLILLGYEYPGAPRGLALLAFVVFCVGAGALLGWFRLRSNSILPAAVAHGAINAWAGVPTLLAAAGAPAALPAGRPGGAAGQSVPGGHGGMPVVVAAPADPRVIHPVDRSARTVATAPTPHLRERCLDLS